MATKHCNGCNKEKTLDSFTNDKKTKDGKATKCKECRKAVDKKYRDANIKKNDIQNNNNNKNNNKNCNGCNLVLAIDMFNKDKYSVDGYTTQCKECRKKNKKEWDQHNKCHKTEYMRDWRKNNKN